MSSPADRMITSDLAALDAEVRRDIPQLRDGSAYRDAMPGAQARRDALAEERRVQLALMPLSIAQVFAHRVGRAAAGAMALLCAVGICAVLADPLLLRAVMWFAPGFGANLGGAMMVAVTGILVTYVVANWIGEAWFTRRMREAITKGADVYGDLDKLAEGPLDVAQELVRKVDPWSVGLAIAGAATLTSVLGYLFVVASSLQPLDFAFTTTSAFAERAARENLGPVAYALALAVGAATYLALATAREHRMGEPPHLLQRASHWSTLAAGAVLGMGVVFATVKMVTHLRFRLPTSEHRYLLAIGAELALLAVVVWGALWWRARERRRLAD